MLQLHILGPAFDLPSIDAECNAAAALLRLHFGDDTDSWELHISHDHTLTLPCLRDDSQTLASGYNAIARRLESLDSWSSRSPPSADATALSSFIQTHGPSLLAINLYVSASNYTSNTRPAFTRILPWHANYILPPHRRAVARKQTEHLGIHSIDVDNVHEDMSHRPQGFEGVGKQDGGFETQAKGRASLLLGSGKATLRGLLQKPEYAATFKLHALAENFFEPLSEMLGHGDHFLGSEEAREVDCLAYGYLGLMLFPKVEQDWLAQTMRTKYPDLLRFTERMHKDLRLSTSVEEVMALRSGGDAATDAKPASLPWRRSQHSSMVNTVMTIATELVHQIPYLGRSPQVITTYPSRTPFWRRYFQPLLLTTLTSLALGGYYAIATGLLVWPHGKRVQIFGRKRLSDYGDLGAAISGISLMGAQIRHGGSGRGEKRVRVEEDSRDDGVVIE
ncbi:hypothetical protein B0A48_13260 [Cryoendolithus antarcticus]|uniref:Mitochondrial outer membrane transport complex Sam37/metaxin N-terminal domain-containing protein n=1 Tax=Cryoendolithus antarcticus TaxID=1507870 RepID=A0A1V8SPD0_9PEZI|nr:hypothetical protein B0A48_13260 [Cryoendolithus antarcticus]